MMHELTKPCMKFYSRQREQNEDNNKLYLI